MSWSPTGAVHERGRDRGVDPAREPAEHVVVAHALADLGDRVVDDVGGGPVGGDAGAHVQEPLEHGLTVRGVQHLRVPLHAVQATLGVLEGGDLGAVGAAGHREARGATTTASRCDIHTGWSHGMPTNSTASGSTVAVVRPNSAPSVRFTVPPSASAMAWKP